MGMRVPGALVPAILSLALLAACSDDRNESPLPEPDPPPTEEPGPEPEPVDLSGLDLETADRCDLTAPTQCLYPFPNDHFTAEDAGTPTGLRVHFAEASMPVAQPVSVEPSQLAPQGVNTTGETPVDPTEWNRNDGFSPGAMIQTHVPGLDLDETGAVRIGDIEQSLAEDAPILMIDAETGERQLIWSELDANAADPERRALIVRPARNLLEGHRYIVALRDLRDADGEPIGPGEVFRGYRDDIAIDNEALEARRPAMEDIFSRLEDSGVAREGLYLAWDFTVASQKSITERLLHIRDKAFSSGIAPQFTVDQVSKEVRGEVRDGLSRGISGTFEVPNFLTTPGGAPGGSFNYASDDADALPQQLNGNDTVTARFRCQVPDSAVADFDDPDSEVIPARAGLYGHGLFGEGPGGEFTSADVRNMQSEHNVLFCATDWIGMATEDFIAGTIHRVLADISLLPQQLDRSQQGLLNFMFLAELLRHEDGFASHEAFRHNGKLVYDPEEVLYDGNSQGGIMGGALVATAPNIHRGVLGVPGSNYSLLLRRFGPFQQRFGFILKRAYPDDLDRTLVIGMMQMLWDRAENNGYLSHLDGRFLPGTPTEKAVLLHTALGDHQVTHWSAEVMARSIGAAIHEPTARLGAHPDENPYFDIPRIASYPHVGNAIMMWDTGDYDPETGNGTPFPPSNNTGPMEGEDPHESPRDTVSARQQKSDFLKSDGAVTNVCGDQPCRTHDYTGLPRE